MTLKSVLLVALAVSAPLGAFASDLDDHKAMSILQYCRALRYRDEVNPEARRLPLLCQIVDDYNPVPTEEQTSPHLPQTNATPLYPRRGEARSDVSTNRYYPEGPSARRIGSAE